MSLLVAMNCLLFIIMMFMFMFMLNFSNYSITLKIFNLSFFGDLEFFFSSWNLLFLILVLVISFSVLFFSFSYMHNMKINNFILLYLSFVLSMSWLILNNNFYWMMLGWDGLGLVSFLLIVYYMNLESISNGLFTLFQNRLGDLFFVLFLIGMWNLNMAFSLSLQWGLFFLVMGSSVKSAQFPFNAWLLAAMSAPTPISSLVHSSTLVVAGVYILLQYSYCLTDFLFFLKMMSLVTLFFSLFGLLNEMDMKKLIAFSTMSHVSLMMFLLSQKLFKLVYFHLNMHAMFKSLMFMAFGFLMLSSFHTQDKRLISYNFMNPQILMIYYFSCFCLAGLPFLTGFFSKDFIIEKFIEYDHSLLDIFFLLLFLGVSIYYSLKLLMLNNPMYAMVICDKQNVGIFSLFIMLCMNFFLVNIYISLVFSLSLEMISFKFIIYLFMGVFLLLSALSNLNFKLFSYSKFSSMADMTFMNVYKLDVYMYFSMLESVSVFSKLSNIKFIVMTNWWVMIILIFMF